MPSSATPADREPLNPIFRVARSLKGMSATMGFGNTARLTHCMEEVLTDLRDGGAAWLTRASDASKGGRLPRTIGC